MLDKMKNKSEKLKILIELGSVHSVLSEQRKAIEYFRQALAIASEIVDKRGEENALGNVGNGYYFFGEVHKASNIMNKLWLLPVKSKTKGMKEFGWATWVELTPGWARYARPSSTTIKP